MKKYFYQTESSTFGPLSFHELWTAARESKLKPHDSIRVEGTRDWVRAENIPGLFAVQEPLTDSELMERQRQDANKKELSQTEERLRAAEKELHRQIELLQKAGKPYVVALPYELAQDYPGSEFALMRVSHIKPKSEFIPRQYPMIDFGIGLLQFAGIIMIVLSLGE